MNKIALILLLLLVAAPAYAHESWKLTVYYTPVEKYHTESPYIDIYGCLVLDCANGESYLGSYPSAFVAAVKEEGAGKITSGSQEGKYLNWSADIGYWLDTVPRDAKGNKLMAFRSAAADISIPFDRKMRIIDCGIDQETAEAIPLSVCRALKRAPWRLTDRFSAGKVGNHIDLYVGEEDREDFTNTSPYMIATESASVRLSR